jgi:hypothetical protein
MQKKVGAAALGGPFQIRRVAQGGDPYGQAPQDIFT